jgi:Flp pilus assembly protein TadG
MIAMGRLCLLGAAMRFFAIGPIVRGAREFLKDQRASVSVDFVVSIPILPAVLAVLVFTSEYGRVLQMRTVLDNAVSDATRDLARAPLNVNGDGYEAEIIVIARRLITSRINSNHINIGSPVITDQTARTSSVDYRTVSLSVAVGVVTSALSVLVD